MDAQELAYNERRNEINNYHYEQRQSDHYDHPRD